MESLFKKLKIFFKKNIPSNRAKSELLLVGTKGTFKGWVRGSSECGLRKEESVWRWGYFHCTLRTVSVWRRVFEWFRCLNFESVWETERVFERLRETVWVGVWNLHVAKIFHISRLANRVKRVLKARVSIESRVFKTRDAINIYCFKIGQLTILLDTLCYLARGFLFWQRYHPKKKKMPVNQTFPTNSPTVPHSFSSPWRGARSSPELAVKFSRSHSSSSIPFCLFT